MEIQDAEFRHSTPVQIRFTDIDMLGHLNNAIYTQFMDQAKVEYFTEVSHEPIDWNEINLVIANINTNFLAQTHLGEHLEVLTRVESIGNKSLVLHQRVINSDTGQVKADGHTVMVAVNLKTGETIPVQEKWRKAMAEFEGSTLDR